MKYYKIANKKASFFYDAKAKIKIVGDAVVAYDGPEEAHTKRALQDGHIKTVTETEYLKYCQAKNLTALTPKAPVAITEAIVDEEAEEGGEDEEEGLTKDDILDMTISELKEYAVEQGVDKATIKEKVKEGKDAFATYLIDTFHGEDE